MLLRCVRCDASPPIVWRYVNGGKIDVAITPRLVDGVPVPVEEDAEITLPAYHVVAHAAFSDYRIVSDGR